MEAEGLWVCVRGKGGRGRKGSVGPRDELARVSLRAGSPVKLALPPSLRGADRQRGAYLVSPEHLEVLPCEVVAGLLAICSLDLEAVGERLADPLHLLLADVELLPK